MHLHHQLPHGETRSRELVARWLHPKLARLAKGEEPWDDWKLDETMPTGSGTSEVPYAGQHTTFPTGRPNRVDYPDGWEAGRVEMNVVNLCDVWVTITCHYDGQWENRTALAPGTGTSLHGYDGEEWSAQVDGVTVHAWNLDTAGGIVHDIVVAPVNAHAMVASGADGSDADKGDS